MQPIIFPYKPRKHQREIMVEIKKSITQGKTIIIESSTGSGKTVCALVPSVEYARAAGKRIVYLTRTNAQQRQVVLEFRRIAALLDGTPAYCVAMQGRQNLCHLIYEDEKFSGGDSDEIGKLCRDRKRKTMESLDAMVNLGLVYTTAITPRDAARDDGGETCRYFAGNCIGDMDSVMDYFTKNMPTAEEFLNYCRENGYCAYEINKELARGALLVVAPYIYLLDNFMRTSLLNWMQCTIEDLIVIVDEAHNVPEYARSLKSAQLGKLSLQMAMRESAEYGDPEVINGVKCSEFCGEVMRILENLVKSYVEEDDALVPPDEFETELMHALSSTSRTILAAAENLIIIGETIRERKRAAGQLPRSYIHSVGAFLYFWMKMDSEKYVKLVVGGDNPRLEGYCLDPSLATDILNACHASVHMSGTLRPLEEYRDSLGLPRDSTLAVYPSPFPKGNMSVRYTKNITTKYERIEEMLPVIRMELSDIISHLDRNTAFFFPSFDLMNRIAGGMDFCGTDVFTEDKEMSQSELLDGIGRFKSAASSGKPAAMFAVCGGRLSEGLDFPDKELEAVVIVGIPYPKPTARQSVLKLYYDLKFNKGWEYTVHAPTARKLMQAVGRMIRKETDRGIAVVLDSRAEIFKEYFYDLKETDNPSKEIRSFPR